MTRQVRHTRMGYNSIILATLMIRLFSFINMRSNSFLFVSHTGHLLRPYRTTLTSHHDWLAPLLLPVRRATHNTLLPFGTSKLFTTFTTFGNRRHPLFVVCLGLFPRTKDIRLGDDACRRIICRDGCCCFLLRLEHCKLAL